MKDESVGDAMEAIFPELGVAWGDSVGSYCYRKGGMEGRVEVGDVFGVWELGDGDVDYG